MLCGDDDCGSSFKQDVLRARLSLPPPQPQPAAAAAVPRVRLSVLMPHCRRRRRPSPDWPSRGGAERTKGKIGGSRVRWRIERVKGT